MVRQNNTQAYGDCNFRRVAEASKLLLGVTQNAPKGTYSTIDEELHMLSQSTIEHDDAFWKNPDNIRALERAEQAALGIPRLATCPVLVWD
nr:hypothetical protein Itr_chr13CG13400 [Ipomoea trifida]